MELNVNGSIVHADGGHTTTFTGNRIGRLSHRKSGRFRPKPATNPSRSELVAFVVSRQATLGGSACRKLLS
jgi:hypothetical protein